LSDAQTEAYTKLENFINEVNTSLSETLGNQKKTIQNIKFELVEILDTKQENMQRQFDMELSRVKTKYDEAIVKVDSASKQLSKLFK